MWLREGFDLVCDIAPVRGFERLSRGKPRRRLCARALPPPHFSGRRASSARNATVPLIRRLGRVKALTKCSRSASGRSWTAFLAHADFRASRADMGWNLSTTTLCYLLIPLPPNRTPACSFHRNIKFPARIPLTKAPKILQRPTTQATHRT